MSSSSTPSTVSTAVKPSGTDPSSAETAGLSIAIVGCGNMGTAILAGLLDAHASSSLKLQQVFACGSSASTKERLANRFLPRWNNILSICVGDNISAMKQSNIIILGFKPYMVYDILSTPSARQALAGKLVISVLVGTPVTRILKCLSMRTLNEDSDYCQNSAERPIVIRVMPNLAATFGESSTVLEIPEMTFAQHHIDTTIEIFKTIGKVTQVTTAQFDAGGVLAGASMAFLTVAIDGILDGAVKEGIKRADARALMAQSLRGLTHLLESGKTGDVIREETSSPRGTTIEGLTGLEEDRVRYAYCRSVERGTKRSKAM